MVEPERMTREMFGYGGVRDDYIVYTPEDDTNKFAYSVFTNEDFEFLCYALGFLVKGETMNKRDRMKYIDKYNLGDVESKRYPNKVRYEFYQDKGLLMVKFFDIEEEILSPVARFDLGNMKSTRDSSIQLDLWGRVKKLWMKKKIAYYEKKRWELEDRSSLSCSTPVIKKKIKKLSRKELLESMAEDFPDEYIF